MKLNSTWFFVIWFGCFTAGAIASCGGGTRIENGPAASSGNASSSGTAGAGGAGGSGIIIIGFGGMGGTSAYDGSVDPNYMPNLFDCDGCACDGATHYCRQVYAGAQVPPAPDAGSCSELDAGWSSCIPIPPDCISAPSCACLDTYNGACQCQLVEEGAGFWVQCFLP